MSDHVAQYKEHLRALFKDDPERSRQILDSMGEGPWHGTGRLNLAVFGMAAEKRFKDDNSHAAVMSFVANASQAMAEAPTPPNPLHIELLVRAALGETALFDEVPSEAANTIMPITAYVMVSELDLTHDQIDTLLDDAQAAVT